MDTELLVKFSTALLVSMESVAIASLSFLILIVCVCSLFFFLVSLAKGLLVLLIFSKNQLLVSLIFFFPPSIDFLFSVSLIPTLILIISFLLLTLDLISSFSYFIK